MRTRLTVLVTCRRALVVTTVGAVARRPHRRGDRLVDDRAPTFPSASLSGVPGYGSYGGYARRCQPVRPEQGHVAFLLPLRRGRARDDPRGLQRGDPRKRRLRPERCTCGGVVGPGPGNFDQPLVVSGAHRGGRDRRRRAEAPACSSRGNGDVITYAPARSAVERIRSAVDCAATASSPSPGTFEGPSRTVTARRSGWSMPPLRRVGTVSARSVPVLWRFSRCPALTAAAIEGRSRAPAWSARAMLPW